MLRYERDLSRVGISESGAPSAGPERLLGDGVPEQHELWPNKYHNGTMVLGLGLRMGIRNGIPLRPPHRLPKPARRNAMESDNLAVGATGAETHTNRRLLLMMPYEQQLEPAGVPDCDSERIYPANFF